MYHHKIVSVSLMSGLHLDDNSKQFEHIRTKRTSPHHLCRTWNIGDFFVFFCQHWFSIFCAGASSNRYIGVELYLISRNEFQWTPIHTLKLRYNERFWFYSGIRYRGWTVPIFALSDKELNSGLNSTDTSWYTPRCAVESTVHFMVEGAECAMWYVSSRITEKLLPDIWCPSARLMKAKSFDSGLRFLMISLLSASLYRQVASFTSQNRPKLSLRK